MISIIIPARNGARMTAQCLSSVLHSCRELNLRSQLVLIDDASDPADGIPETFASIRGMASDHEILGIRAKNHLHYSGVVSAGLFFAAHQEILFISNDMVVTPHFIAALLEVARQDSRAGVVRGTSNWTDSHPEHQVEPPQPLTSFSDVLAFSARRYKEEGLAVVEDRMLSGDAVLIKRALIDEIGVFDCRFFGYFSDLDFGMRAHLAGFKLVCAKGAWLYHLGAGHLQMTLKKTGRSMESLTAERMELVHAAYLAFRRKWDLALPEEFTGVSSIDWNAVSEQVPQRPPLRCDLPSGFLENLLRT